MIEPFDIFIGGPMGDKGKDPGGVPFADHIEILEVALGRIASELNDRQARWRVQVSSPRDRDNAGDIVTEVFGMINDAELAILDISANSPSVMYELAVCHALGIPTIPLFVRPPDKDAPQPKTPFYLLHTYQARVPNFDADSLYEVLAPKVAALVVGEPEWSGSDYPESNALSKFYGEIALVDVSSSMGLATGYFHNFVRHVIRANGGIIRRFESEVDKLLIVRPESLYDAEGLKSQVERRLAAAGIELRKLSVDSKELLEDATHARGQIFAFAAKRFVVDTPAPLAAQLSSPRFQRAVNRIYADRRRPKPLAEERKIKLENRLIDQFEDRLQFLARTRPESDPRLMEFVTVDELMARLED